MFHEKGFKGLDSYGKLIFVPYLSSSFHQCRFASEQNRATKLVE